MSIGESVWVAAGDIGCYMEASRDYGVRISRRRQPDGSYRVWLVERLNPLAKVSSADLMAELTRRSVTVTPDIFPSSAPRP